MLPPSKRTLRPTASQPTTAEHYGQKHGIPDDIQAALQNVGRKGRMAVSQGRTLDRTQSFPVSSTSHNPFDTFDIPPPRGFMTSQQTFEQAQQTLQSNTRRNELKPYSDTLDPDYITPTLPGSSPPHGASELAFGEEGMEEDNDTQEGLARGKGGKARNRPFIPSKKRKEDQEGTDTETEEDAEEGVIFAQEGGVPGSTFGSTSTANTDEFPAVFTSPQITQPELFMGQGGRGLPSRLVKGMPGRMLGKTVSAPVGGLGRWGGVGVGGVGSAGGGMDVDGVQEGGEDGFDVGDWAASENF